MEIPKGHYIFGTVKVGERGQIIIPKEARETFQIKPGDMLIFTAGQSPIYGRQILYFFDPVFSARAKIPVPGLTPQYQSGITDSLYEPRPAAWYSATPVVAAPPEKNEAFSEQYFVA